MLIPPDQYRGFATPWSKTLSEGRWISLLWTKLSYNLSLTGVYLWFLAIYTLLCIGLFRVLSGGGAAKFSALASATLFFSALAGENAQWPTGMIPPFFFSMVAVWLMTTIVGSATTLAVYLLIYLTVMSYPPMAAVIFLTYIVCVRPSDARAWLVSNVSYVAVFGSAVFSIFSLNYIYHGTFGVVPESWREPRNPLLSLSQFSPNLWRYSEFWVSAWAAMKWPLVVSGFAYVLCLWLDVRRSACFGGPGHRPRARRHGRLPIHSVRPSGPSSRWPMAVGAPLRPMHLPLLHSALYRGWSGALNGVPSLRRLNLVRSW